MDAFFASVEQRDHAEWRGKPLVVGGPPNSRGVVCAASYEARKYGVKSAMSCYRAYQLCPNAIFTPPRFEVYRLISKQIREIFLEYTDLVEPLSLDEAYLDVTVNKLGIQHASVIAKEIRRRVYEKTGLTCSAGVAENKLLAKIASEQNKPNGLFVILPNDSHNYLADLKLSKFHGIGKITFEKMQSFGWEFGRDLLKIKEEELIKHFGKMGRRYFEMVRGIDDRPVESSREAKSIAVETTFEKDSDDFDSLLLVLENLAIELSNRINKRDRMGKTLTIKVKYADFTLKSRSVTSESFLYLAKDIADQSSNLFRNFWSENVSSSKKVRLLGISLSNLNHLMATDDGQLSLF